MGLIGLGSFKMNVVNRFCWSFWRWLWFSLGEKYVACNRILWTKDSLKIIAIQYNLRSKHLCLELISNSEFFRNHRLPSQLIGSQLIPIISSSVVSEKNPVVLKPADVYKSQMEAANSFSVVHSTGAYIIGLVLPIYYFNSSWKYCFSWSISELFFP